MISYTCQLQSVVKRSIAHSLAKCKDLSNITLNIYSTAKTGIGKYAEVVE